MSFMLLLLSSIMSLNLCFARNPFPDRTDSGFLSECLSTTNQLRTKHQSPALRMDSQLTKYAKSRCRQVSRSEGLSAGHSGLKSGVGENLFWGGNTRNSYQNCKNGVTSWYNEVKHYNYNSPGFSKKTGHFTQLIWKSTTNLGCARCGGKGSQWYETYVVCNYSPPGNFQGKFPDNVLRSK